MTLFFAMPAWVEDAACTDVDPEIFFPDQGHGCAEAKAVCDTCPVQTECLDYALGFENTITKFGRYGVYAGLTPQQRADITRRSA